MKSDGFLTLPKILWTIENHHHLVGVCYKKLKPFSNHRHSSLRIYLDLFAFVCSMQIHFSGI